MLPQQPDDGNEAAAVARGGHVDNVSDNGSFHASVWEEERLKRSHVRWAGDRTNEEQQQPPRATSNNREEDHQGHLRREPTPFPKEMRAMAKRMQNLRQTGKEASVTMSHGGSEYRRVTRWSSWRYYLGAQLWCQKSLKPIV